MRGIGERESKHALITCQRERDPWTPGLFLAPHCPKNRVPLRSFDVIAHVFVHATVGAAVVASNVEGLHDAELMLEGVFVFAVGRVENVGAFDFPVTFRHVLCEARVFVVTRLSCFHMLSVASFEVFCCLTDV